MISASDMLHNLAVCHLAGMSRSELVATRDEYRAKSHYDVIGSILARVADDIDRHLACRPT